MSTDFCKNNNLLTCLDPNDLAGIHKHCSVTADPTAIYEGLVVADIAGYPLLNGRIGYDSASPANQIGCYRAASASQSGGSPCHDSSGTPIQGYLACTPDTCASKPYDTNFPLNKCQNGVGDSFYVSIAGNYKHDAICKYNGNQVTACAQLCDPPCANGGVCTMVNDRPVCDCSNAQVNFTDCFGSCRGTPKGRTWTFQYSGNTCESLPTGLPDDFVTQMRRHHDGDNDFVCNSNPFGKICQNGVSLGIVNKTDCDWEGDCGCTAQGQICGAYTDQRAHNTGSDWGDSGRNTSGNCNC